MKIVNPKEGKCPALEADEPFMLWCPKRKIYIIAVITLWYISSNQYVIRDTQSPRNTQVAEFCVVASNSKDLFDRVHEANQILIQDTYTIYYV